MPDTSTGNEPNQALEARVQKLVRAGRITGGMVKDALVDAACSSWTCAQLPYPTHPQASVLGRCRTIRVRKKGQSGQRTDRGEMVQFLDSLKSGDVVCVSVWPNDSAFWGELLSAFAQVRGVLGTIVLGRSRDFGRIQKTGYPVWAQGWTPNDTGDAYEVFRDPLDSSEKGTWAFVDRDGALFFSAEDRDVVFEKLLKRVAIEDATLASIAGGISAQELNAQGIRL